MQKTRKKLVGLVCLALVALMTIVAYFMPTPASATGDSHTDVIRVTVYDQYPSVVITSPETDSIGVSEELEVKFSYENANHVEFVLSYAKVDDEGNPILDEEGILSMRKSPSLSSTQKSSMRHSSMILAMVQLRLGSAIIFPRLTPICLEITMATLS